jgi:hypothetical protein
LFKQTAAEFNLPDAFETGERGGRRFGTKAGGDTFKDTAGASLRVLIKLLSTINLVLAPSFIQVSSFTFRVSGSDRNPERVT